MTNANPADAVGEALDALQTLESAIDGETDCTDTIRQHIAALTERGAELEAEISMLYEIAGYGGVSADAPERLILASEMFDGLQACDKWCDVRRVVDEGQPMPESATAYVRADIAEASEREAARWKARFDYLAQQLGDVSIGNMDPTAHHFDANEMMDDGGWPAAWLLAVEAEMRSQGVGG